MRARVALLLIVGLLCAPLLLLATRLRIATPPIAVLWEHRVPRGATAALSPDGSLVVVVTREGRLTAYNAGGRLQMNLLLPGARTATVASTGSVIVAWAPAPTAERRFYVLSRGQVVYAGRARSAVTAVSVTRRGERIALADASGLILSLEPSARPPQPREWRAPGAVSGLAWGSGDSLLVATRSPAGLTRYDAHGRLRGEFRPERAGRCVLAPAPGGGAAALLVEHLPGPGTTLQLRRGSGDQAWSADLSGDQSAASVAGDGSAVLVAHRQRLVSRVTGTRWSVEAYDRDGRRLWRRGSTFMSLRPVAVAADGRMALVHDRRRLLLLGADGVTRWRTPAPEIQATSVGADGARVLARDARGLLRLYRIAWRPALHAK